MKSKLNRALFLCLSIIILVGCEQNGSQNKPNENQSKPASDPSSVRIAEFIHWYPAIEQAKMRDAWLSENQYGAWTFSGMVTADDRTVITPQADVNYGYSWFNISNEPVVVTMPEYDKYYSLSVFDMNHFVEVKVMPKKPIVIRLPSQTSPIKDALEIVINTYQGLAFTRQVIVGNEPEVMDLAKNITITGGGGDFPFTIPEFTEEETAAGLELIKAYGLQQKDGTRLFGSQFEGVGDMDRAAGVFLGQLGTQARYVQYTQYVKDQNGEPVKGTGTYEITVPANGLVKDSNGYWSLTIYSMEDRYLIPNSKNRYSFTSYEAKPNSDGTFTLRINPEGDGENAIPTAGVDFYGVFRVYNPVENLTFPQIERN
ncbi:hypothetical protein Aoki45_20740 [Algoriphagus sp. oki45]|uniref:DUF1214 domain-containing protein n=1 Tax=Algoriphagus sp. oki45 TaxID=3067294 RepID=UPI0027FD7C5A|nr:hypothetical protein Aoki45_20740 [Algoriphagus sp. oki45]